MVEDADATPELLESDETAPACVPAYKRVSLDDRETILRAAALGKTPTEIAQELGFHRTTVMLLRERRRTNSCQKSLRQADSLGAHWRS